MYFTQNLITIHYVPFAPQKRKDDRFLALLEDERGLLRGQLRTEQGLQGRRIQSVHILCRRGPSPMS